MQSLRTSLLFPLLLFTALACHAEPRVLIYTRNGPTLDGKKGFVHDNIACCVGALEKLDKDAGFASDVSEDPAVFTEANLKQYRVLVFANSNNRAFDTEEQKSAFQHFIHNGGGFVGIHSASGSERNWPWFWSLLGGSFSFHAPFQKFTVNVVDKQHPSTSGFPSDTWAWEDEFYVMKSVPPGLHVLLAGNIKPLKMPEPQRKLAEAMPDSIPLAWCHEFEGGRAFYTALGHKKESYSDATFQKHLIGGIRWAMGNLEK